MNTPHYFNDFGQRNKLMSRFVTGFIGVVALLAGCIIGLQIYVAYLAISTATEQDWSNGIKPVIEKVWCGAPGCMEDK